MCTPSPAHHRLPNSPTAQREPEGATLSGRPWDPTSHWGSPTVSPPARSLLGCLLLGEDVSLPF